VVVITAGYVLGLYFQSRSITHLDKRIDDLRSDIMPRIEDLRSALMADIGSEIKRVEGRLDHVEARLERVEGRLERLEHSLVRR